MSNIYIVNVRGMQVVFGLHDYDWYNDPLEMLGEVCVQKHRSGKVRILQMVVDLDEEVHNLTLQRWPQLVSLWPNEIRGISPEADSILSRADLVTVYDVLRMPYSVWTSLSTEDRQQIESQLKEMDLFRSMLLPLELRGCFRGKVCM